MNDGGIGGRRVILRDRVYLAALKALLSLRDQESVDNIISRQEQRLRKKNRGGLYSWQKRRLDILQRWNDERS